MKTNKYESEFQEWIIPEEARISTRHRGTFSIGAHKGYLAACARREKERRELAEAIIARINGEFDAPALLKFGPLSPIVMDDVLAIARATSPNPQAKLKVSPA